MRRLNLKRMHLSKGRSEKPKPKRPFCVCEECGELMYVSSTQETVRYFKCPACGATAKKNRKK